MQENPIVSVICLCYNHANFVVECLQSIEKQTYKNIEIIVVDDYSTDNSVDIINDYIVNYPKIRFVANKINLGNTKSFNQALEIAAGDYVIDLATDDVLLINCVALQLDKFKNSHYNNVGIVYGNAENILENGKHDSYYYTINKADNLQKPRQTGDIYKQVLAGGDSYCSASAMTTMAVYKDLNGYDETLQYEDLDFWIRATRKYNVDYIDEILMQKRIVKNSLGSQFFKRNHKINESTYQILKKALYINKTKEEDLALLKRVHYEIYYCFKNKIINLLVKNIGLKIYLFVRLNFGINYK